MYVGAYQHRIAKAQTARFFSFESAQNNYMKTPEDFVTKAHSMIVAQNVNHK